MGKLRLRTPMRLASVLLLATLGAACQDSPTLLAPVQRPTPSIARFDQGQHLGQTPFFCTLGRSAPSSPTGWQTRRLTIFIPRGELDEAGRTVRYEYRRPSSDGRSLMTALCTVPYTEGALRRVDRTLGVEGSGGAEQFRARQGMVTTQGGCVTSPDGVCPVDPIIVIAPPRDRTKEVQCPVMDPSCGSSGGDEGWGDGSWGGGGGDGSLEGDDDGDGDTLDDGPAAFGVCVAVGFGVDGWFAIGGSAYAGYRLFDARADVRARYTEYRAYNTSHAVNSEWSQAVNDLYYQNYQSALTAEEALWAALATTGGMAAWKIGAAVTKCAPLLGAPTV